MFAESAVRVKFEDLQIDDKHCYNAQGIAEDYAFDQSNSFVENEQVSVSAKEEAEEMARAREVFPFLAYCSFD